MRRAQVEVIAKAESMAMAKGGLRPATMAKMESMAKGWEQG